MLQQVLVMIKYFGSGVWANLRGPLLVPRCTYYVKVATGQVASTGMVTLSYVQKISDKVSLASDVMYNCVFRDVTASFGYNYILRQCRHRGNVDSNGCVAAFLEENLNMDLNFVLPVEADAGQVASTGMVAPAYVQNRALCVTICLRMLQEALVMITSFGRLLLVSPASDMYNYIFRDVTASFCYDHILRQLTFNCIFFVKILLDFLLVLILILQLLCISSSFAISCWL